MSSVFFRRSCLVVGLAALMFSACGSDENDSNNSSDETGGKANDDDDDNDAAAAGGGNESSGTGGSGATVDVAPIVINELMPSNKNTVADNSGAFPDWIELYNPTKEDVDLGGYYVSDSAKEPTRFSLPKGLMIDAKGYLLLWADGDTDQGENHLPFKLAADKEGAVLSGPGGELLDPVKYEGASEDASYARIPNEKGEFAWCAEPTPGEANPDECAGVTIPEGSGGTAGSGSD